MIEKGQIFGAVGDESPKQIALVCEVQTIKNGRATCYVINGAWSGLTFDIATGKSLRPFAGYTIAFTDEIPEDVDRSSYNELIYYMQDRLS